MAALVHCVGHLLDVASDVAGELLRGEPVHCPLACPVLLGSPPLRQPSVISMAPTPLHCHDGAAYTVVRVADALFVSVLEALPAPPLYSALNLLWMDEWLEATPLAPPPPDGVDDAASDSGASSRSDTSSHSDDPLQ